jgi:adenylate/nucleoside-diphosphate kinase
MCASIFLDVQQAFDKGWHEGLLYKLKSQLPDQLCLVLKLYLEGRYSQVRIDYTFCDNHQIKPGVPQVSVIRPLHYLIYTAYAPTRKDTLIATFTDDTFILSSDADPARAPERLHYLRLLQKWLKKWKIEVYPVKSTQVIFITG